MSKVNVAKCTSGVKESSKEIQAIQRWCNGYFLCSDLVAAVSTRVQGEEGSIRTSSAEEISNCEWKMKQYNTFICLNIKEVEFNGSWNEIDNHANTSWWE